MNGDAGAAERWRRIEELFAAAVELPAGERDAFLAAACDDAGLRREVEELLAADRGAGGEAVAGADPVARAVAAGARAFARDRSAAAPGRRLGAYRLLREIGRGGMSSVYLAARDDDAFEQRVAVKLIRPGFESGEILDRFLHERQILARLDHPFIARLHDGGTTAEGHPFFVMEHVDGEPIDDWCDHRRLSTRERLRLFLQVCEAVHAAHRNLVVHRDLKPSNVLVTADGVPKLLDFGIAKPIDGARSGLDDLTVTGMRPMTPQYASPEQISGGAVTTASDVYSLGVLLYRLLTGRLPQPRALRSAAEWERAVLEAPAEPASRALMRRDDGPPPDEVAALRGTSVEALRRRLAGDLDTVITKALDREPERRYGSVEQFAEDVSRHLDGRPVIARPATAGYRLAKFVRRHRLATAAAVLVLVAVVVAATLFALQARRVTRERDRANQVADLLADLFAIADPREARGGSITARELLDRGAERVAALDDQPRTQSMLLGKLAELYEPLGLYDEAAELLDRAIAIERRLEAAGGDERRELAVRLNHLGRVRARDGDYVAAEPLFAEAAERFGRLSGEDGMDVALILNNLALVRHDLGDYAAAADGYRRSIEIETRLSGSAHPFTVGNFGLLLVDLGEYDEAVEVMRGVVGDARRDGDDEENLASALDHLGLALLGRGDHAAAEAALAEAAELRSALFGADHPETARTVAALGVLARERGDLAGAERWLDRALADRRAALGDDHPEVAESLRERAALSALQGDGAAAEAAYREALAIQRGALSEHHPLTGLTMGGFGALLAARGDCGAARPLLERSLDLVPEKDWRLGRVEAAWEGCSEEAAEEEEEDAVAAGASPDATSSTVGGYGSSSPGVTPPIGSCGTTSPGPV
ncbi:MAG TPA: tetratricopeptide repeat protein [Thermoanaerobaculia bacterium]|nr:tetratricopeptide repeat protein [Thermoanaerobaculia bacterium]